MPMVIKDRCEFIGRPGGIQGIFNTGLIGTNRNIMRSDIRQIPADLHLSQSAKHERFGRDLPEGNYPLLIVIRLTFFLASSVLGRLMFKTPFLKLAFALSVSTPSGRATTRLKAP